MEQPGAERLYILQLDAAWMQPQWMLCVCPACAASLQQAEPLCCTLALLEPSATVCQAGVNDHCLQLTCGIHVPHAEPAVRSNLWRCRSHAQPHLLTRCAAMFWLRPASSIPLPAHRHAVQAPVWPSV